MNTIILFSKILFGNSAMGRHFWTLISSLALTLCLLAACDLTYRESADATVRIEGEAEAVTVTLLTSKDAVVYRKSTSLRSGTSHVFPSVFFGDYTVTAEGSDSRGRLYTGSGQLSVSDGGENSVTLTLEPSQDARGQVHIEKTISWAGSPVSPALLIMELEGEELGRFPIEEGSKELTVSQNVLASPGDSLTFTFIDGNGLILGTAEGSVSGTEPIEALLAEPEAVRNLVLRFDEGYESLSYSFSLPEGEWETIRIRYSDGRASHPVEIPASAAVDGICSGHIDKIRSGADYTISVTLVKSTGETSQTLTATLKAPVPLESVSIAAPTQTLIPGMEPVRLLLSSYPINASDMGGEWSSSNESVLTVDEEGWLTVKGYGRSTVSYRAVNNNRLASRLIAVNMIAPVVKAVAEDGCIAIEWNPVALADEYVLSRHVDGVPDTSFSVITEETEYTDTDVVAGRSYAYTVRSLDTESQANATSAMSESITIAPPSIVIEIPGGPQQLDVCFDLPDDTVLSPEKPQLTVTALVEGASSYEWYINDSKKPSSTQSSLTLDYRMDGISYDMESGIQLLTLVVTDSTGKAYSASSPFRVETGNAENI